jgi:hypothetical protein
MFSIFSSVPQSCYWHDYWLKWATSVVTHFLSLHLGLVFRSAQTTSWNFDDLEICLLQCHCLNFFVGSIPYCAVIFTLRKFCIYNCSQTPNPISALSLTFGMPHGAETKVHILFSCIGVCFTVGLLVTSDTVPYSHRLTGICKRLSGANSSWTWGNNGGHVATNTRIFSTVRCTSYCILDSWFVVSYVFKYSAVEVFKR